MPRAIETEEKLEDILRHIQSLGVVTKEQIGARTDGLLRSGYLEKVWINGYALTQKGENRIKRNV